MEVTQSEFTIVQVLAEFGFAITDRYEISHTSSITYGTLFQKK